MKDKLEHNQWIAAALNFKPVSKVFIIVKADMRMANVCDGIRKYSDRFIELEPDAIGVLVTFMDTVDWSKQQMKEAIEELETTATKVSDVADLKEDLANPIGDDINDLDNSLAALEGQVLIKN